MSKNQQATLWAVVAALVTAFGQELAAGNIPLPSEHRWLIPIIVAAISALSPYVRPGRPRDASRSITPPHG